MTEPKSKINSHFMNLVMMLQMSAMQSMGKIASPVSGEIEKNLDHCRVSIDMLEMLAEKTSGNLNEDEKKYIDSTLYNLRMNYLEEYNKADEEKAESDIDKKNQTENPDKTDTSEAKKPENNQSTAEKSDY